MTRDAWVELPRHRYDRVWDRFDEAFQFRPSVDPEDWPTFRVPGPSVTYRISEQLSEFSPWRDPKAAPYNLALLRALLACVEEGEPVLALDWQHAGYEFYPHRLREPQEVKNWCIPALPSGEYHLFVTEDHRLGSLGHPWEETVCVFGEGFVEEYRRLTPLRPEQIIRQQAGEEADEPPARGKGGRARPRRYFGGRGRS
jgi:hypothetical protein